MKAAPSTRALDKVNLTFGLINIPITLYTGTVSTQGVERHDYLPVPVMVEEIVDIVQDDGTTAKVPTQVQKTVEVEREDGTTEQVPVFEDHLIGRGNTDKETGELLTEDEKVLVQKKISTEYGPVYVEDHEIEALFSLEQKTLRVKEFQPQHLFHAGLYVPKTLNFVEPRKTETRGKPYDPIATKLLATLLKALREEGMVAVCELTTRGVPRPAILTADGALWHVYHTDALREQREFPEVELVDAEVTMMRTFLNTMKTTEVADLTDVRSELIQNFADEKAAAGDFDRSEDTVVPVAPAASVDLMSLLSASVDAAKAQQEAV